MFVSLAFAKLIPVGFQLAFFFWERYDNDNDALE